MRKVVGLGLLAGLVVTSSGCVVAMGNRRAVAAPRERYPVAINGEVFLVNVEDGTMCKVPPAATPCETSPIQASSR